MAIVDKINALTPDGHGATIEEALANLKMSSFGGGVVIEECTFGELGDDLYGWTTTRSAYDIIADYVSGKVVRFHLNKEEDTTVHGAVEMYAELSGYTPADEGLDVADDQYVILGFLEDFGGPYKADNGKLVFYQTTNGGGAQ